MIIAINIPSLHGLPVPKKKLPIWIAGLMLRF